jgi:hypothetical protein
MKQSVKYSTKNPGQNGYTMFFYLYTVHISPTIQIKPILKCTVKVRNDLSHGHLENGANSNSRKKYGCSLFVTGPAHIFLFKIYLIENKIP